MKTTALVLVTIASLLTSFTARASTTSTTFVSLSATDEPFRTAFNRQKGSVRVVELVSPTCPYCLEGVSEIQQALFAKEPDPKLVGFVIWVPMLNGKASNVPDAMKLAQDPRVHHYWDQTNDLGIAFQQLLPIATGPAWDVYMLYAPGAVWNGRQPPRPLFWMHQLAITNAPHLDPAVFAQRAVSLLSQNH